jgi:hypothetical protein
LKANGTFLSESSLVLTNINANTEFGSILLNSYRILEAWFEIISPTPLEKIGFWNSRQQYYLIAIFDKFLFCPANDRGNQVQNWRVN